MRSSVLNPLVGNVRNRESRRVVESCGWRGVAGPCKEGRPIDGVEKPVVGTPFLQEVGDDRQQTANSEEMEESAIDSLSALSL